MAEGQQINDLIATLEQSVESGLAYFQGPGGESKVKIGRYEPREFLCQLLWWHQATTEAMESVAAGRAPYRVYASVDELNARAVGRAAGKEVNQSGTYGPSLVDTVRQLQARLVKAARAIQDPNTTVLIMGDGRGHSVQQCIESITTHWTERVNELRVLGAA